jgi:hypothetical protein
VPENTGEEVRTHIRGAWVDYLVEDYLDAFNAPLHDNVVVSPITGVCPAPGGLLVGDWPYSCPSREDPSFPAIAAVNSFGALVVWQQKLDYAADANIEIAGRALLPNPPANDAPSDATDITNTSLELNGTLLGADIDGVASCGHADEEPDVWYAYTAPYAGVLHINTCGTHDQFVTDTGMDTVLSLHRPDGSQFDGACNDDAVGGNDATACAGADLGNERDSALQRIVHGGETVLARVSRYGYPYGYPDGGAQFLVNNSFEVLADSDEDGYADIADNCWTVANETQYDADGDGIGNMCDCDFNQDNFCGGPDFTLFIGCFNASTNGDPTCEAADMNGDGFVGGPDFTLFIGLFNGPPGPSGL